ncbi:MAG: 2-hydroxyacid dehydrogenase [candidate division WOR-3 bacterium]
MKKYNVLVLIPEIEESHRELFLKTLGENCKLYFEIEQAPVEEIHGIIIFRFEGVLNLELLKKMRSLKYIQAITAGIDHIPVKEISSLGIRVEGAPGSNSHFIAEHAFAMILSAIKKICFHTASMRRGEFHQEFIHRTLYGMNLLILGFGTIGQAVARIARVFDMKIRVFKKHSEIPGEFIGSVEKVYTSKPELDEAWGWADYIVLALPLTDETRGFIGELELRKMKRDVVLVNVARGKLIDEEALYSHLSENPDFIACLDTWWVYPEQGQNFMQHYDFASLPNVVMTPHVAPKVQGFFENMIVNASKRLLSRLEEGWG